MLLLYAVRKNGTSPEATSCAVWMWPWRISGFVAASFLKKAMPFSSPIALATAANQSTSVPSIVILPLQRGCSRSS